LLAAPLRSAVQGAMYGVVYKQAQPAMSTTMTVRLNDDVKDRLEALAGATQRSKSFLAAEAIRAYVETNEWHIGEIQAALKEAEAGDFAADKDVAALAKKWKANAG
jgi:RHH-type rel operon transcriptional repressor/antitoxin RelB